MTYVNISALSFPEGAAEEIEQRFAQRAKGVDQAEGFEGFELLRPVSGEDRYFVITRWDSQENYQKWSDARPEGNHVEDEKRGMAVDVLGFESIQLES
ncbi:antibiotic biosynthesis monooxygenase [Corynebacterium pseudodiphtheriticum]|uniref:antibiotic biosynthesis monooxygenase family protein n=1 Tax=Corynebacterium pseudodiphtheriticum TaxID=37637 RepID=UPI002543C234|nr:antibiotic biosynthesis monooxygenase [Corynebacterium pseudodiphtheriticum]MDK4328529.1 antibiotic biosynthesis monooxygenase [Corynebacterium pseudodiphtheriticum]